MLFSGAGGWAQHVHVHGHSTLNAVPVSNPPPYGGPVGGGDHLGPGGVGLVVDPDNPSFIYSLT